MLFPCGRGVTANATLGAGPGFLLASTTLSLVRATVNRRQQNNGRTRLGAFHPDTEAKNDFHPHDLWFLA